MAINNNVSVQYNDGLSPTLYCFLSNVTTIGEPMKIFCLCSL